MVSESGLFHALREIHAIAPDFPRLIFTGQETLVDNDDYQGKVDVPIFYKYADSDPLYTELRKQIDARPDAELRRRYPDICNLCDGEFLPSSKWSETLFPALKEAHEGTHNPSRFNDLRKVLEAALKSLCANVILPESFDEGGQVNLKYCELFLKGYSVTPHQQYVLHYLPATPLLDITDQARIQLLKIITSEESHENQHHRSVADLSCAIFTLVSLLPSLKALSQTTPNWTPLDFSQAEYEIPGRIHDNRRFLSFKPLVKIRGPIRMDDLIRNNSLQPEDKIWVKCRTDAQGYHQPLDVRPMN